LCRIIRDEIFGTIRLEQQRPSAGFGGAAVSIGVASESPSMNDLVLDPSETRQPRDAASAASRAVLAGGLGRLALGTALVGALGLAGLGAFAGATSLMSSLIPPKPAPAMASRHKAADWPDLKDGLPSLAGASSGTAQARIALPPAEPPAPPATTQAALPEPMHAAPEPSAFKPLAPEAPAIRSADRGAPEVKPSETRPAAIPAAPPAQAAARPAPPIENASVIGPTRQASTLPPSRTVATLPARAAETVRARTASTTFAALPPDSAKETPRIEASKPDPVKSEAPALDHSAAPAAPEAKPAARGEKPEAKPKAKPVQARKPVAAPTTVAAAAPPDEADETEVFGIKMPTLSATGRKIGAGVEALGDAVKSLPDKF
jgi:hypothetical protein